MFRALSAPRIRRPLLAASLAAAALFAPAAALGFSHHEHQDLGEVAAKAALREAPLLDPSLRLPWRDKAGRVLASASPQGPRFGAGQAMRGVTFGELIAVYGDVVDVGGGITKPAVEQLNGATDPQLLSFLEVIGRTPGLYGKPDPTLKQRAIELLAVNKTHFSKDAVETYLRWHREALAFAAQAARTGDLTWLWKAMHVDALGCHSLSDLFSTGHSILDRTASMQLQKDFDALNQKGGGGAEGTLTYLRKNVKSILFDPSMFKLVFSKLKGGALALYTGFLHESYNSNGAIMTSVEVPRGWQSYGDTFYGKSLDNLRLVRTAVYRSIKGVLAAYAAFKRHVAPARFAQAVRAAQQDPAYFRALRLLPITYRGAQRFAEMKGAGDWVKLLLAIITQTRGYGSESFGREGGLRMAPLQAGSTNFKDLVLQVLRSRVSLAAYYKPGARAVALRDADLSTRAYPYNPVVVGLEVNAPFSNRQLTFRGVVRELYGNLARIEYKSKIEGYVPLASLSAGAPTNLRAPTKVNHRWRVGMKVRAPFRTPKDLVNGVVKQVYGKLIQVAFVTGDLGWALGMRAGPLVPSLIPDALHPRRILGAALNKVDSVGQSLLGKTTYTWMRDFIDTAATKLADKVSGALQSAEALFGDVAHMMHNDCIKKHVPDLAAKLAGEIGKEVEVRIAEFWERVDKASVATSQAARHTVRDAWVRIVADIGTMQTRTADEGSKKVARWYPLNAGNRKKGVAKFQETFAAHAAKLRDLVARYGKPLDAPAPAAK